MPFKTEVGSLLESLGKTNASEVASLARRLEALETAGKSADLKLNAVGDRVEGLAAEARLAAVAQRTGQSTEIVDAARESGRAEALAVVGTRLNDEIAGLEDRLGKKIEDIEKRTKGVEKKIEASKAEGEEQKAQYDALAAKLEDIGKLVAELTINSGKDSKEDISNFQ